MNVPTTTAGSSSRPSSPSHPAQNWLDAETAAGPSAFIFRNPEWELKIHYAPRKERIKKPSPKTWSDPWLWQSSWSPKAKEHFVILSTSPAFEVWAHYIIHWLKSGPLIGLTPDRGSADKNFPLLVAVTVWFKLKKIGISFIYFLIMWKNSPFPGERPRKCCICIHQSILTTPWGLPSEKWQLRET